MPFVCPPIDVLFLSELPLFPLDQGFKVHGYHMARELTRRGLSVGVATMRPTDDPGAPGVPGMPADLAAMLLDWPVAEAAMTERFLAGWSGVLAPLRRRLAARQGLDPAQLAGAVGLVEHYRPAAVVALGRHGPALLRGVSRVRRPGTATNKAKHIWYAADDPAWFNITLLPTLPVTRWPAKLVAAMCDALFERAFADALDAAIGVSDQDTRMLGMIAGVHRAVTIRNGVDLDYFTPAVPIEDGVPRLVPQGKSCGAAEVKTGLRWAGYIEGKSCGATVSGGTARLDLASLGTSRGTQKHSLIFWGRLDFEPNIDAVTWFAREVLPAVRRRFSDATFTILGKGATPMIAALADQRGIDVLGEVPDIRPYAHAATAVVLPLRSGGGIKNKLLEAAAMGKAIIASPRTVAGLPGSDRHTPALCCRTSSQWVETISRLFTDPSLARRQGEAARRWAETHHTWEAAGAAFSSLIGGESQMVMADSLAINNSHQEQPPAQAA